MRKFLSVIAAISILASCAAPTPKTTDDDIIEEEEDGFDDFDFSGMTTTADVQTLMATLENAQGMRSTAEAVRLAGLADLLGSEGPFTIFVPTDEAWQQFLSGNLSFLDNPEAVKQALMYHVVQGALRTEIIGEKVQGLELRQPSAGGPELVIAYYDGIIKINGAEVLSADIEATNGVIHVIDQVLTIP